MSDNEIVVISGVRRCGKSTLLNEIRSKNKEQDYYLNFDDERLVHFTLDDFQKTCELFVELFGNQKTYYFDEIQNIKGWERFVRRLYDYGNKVFVTGSNASMLSRELGTHLTGRFYQFELYPFSFSEFIALKNERIEKTDAYTTKGKGKLKRLFNEYFSVGSFPDYITNRNKDYLKSLYQSILYRDVLVRNKLTNEKEMLELVYFLSSNVARPVTYNSLAKTVEIKNASTIKNYLENLENTYLLFLVHKYDTSLKKQMFNAKKSYFIDLALIRELGFHVSADNGRLLENLVFIELKRRSKEVYYHRNKYECDFVIKEKTKIINAIQVSWTMEDKTTKEREINGLIEALKIYNLQEGLILTENEEKEIKIGSKKILIYPVWKWMLNL